MIFLARAGRRAEAVRVAEREIDRNPDLLLVFLVRIVEFAVAANYLQEVATFAPVLA